MFDAHCHLDDERFVGDHEAMFARAQAAGVERFMVPGTSRQRWDAVLALGHRDDVSVGLGLHPYFIEQHREEDIEALAAALQCHGGVVAVGECGIDARFEETLARQWVLFDAQLKLAKQFRLPVVIHCVHANDHVAKRLRQLALPAGGLIHAFSGSEQQARRFLELGYRLGLGGAVTHEGAKRLRRTVQALPDSGFVLETDSPDMPPAGRRGRRNEPANLVETLAVVAMLRGQSPAHVARCAWRNTLELFRLPVD
nr:TatD family hydrolase [Salinicola sp. S1-1-2]